MTSGCLMPWFFITSTLSLGFTENLVEFRGLPSFLERSSRSVGSIATAIDDYPFMASIRFAGKHICGGSILTKSIILTAGHCVDPEDKRDLWYVKVGDADMNFRGSWHKVERMLRHDKYQRFELSEDGDHQLINDVGLIQLSDPIEIDNMTTKTIELFKENNDINNYTSGILTGWGNIPEVVLLYKQDTKENSIQYGKTRKLEPPSKLRAVELNIGTEDMCALINPKAILENQFCTHTLGKLPCSGDSGSPLVVNGSLAGIFSWGDLRCNEGLNTGYFTDVAKYRKWIDDWVHELGYMNIQNYQSSEERN
ncbi:hypothetical protein QAD02_022217 [Eretmocerus hayati]|uniref:Uncharacterized protein n=1 Tax=Eretmocerus hayati TaxID=131215 RepID=A0ACC2PSF9_9HYME|nr:hypothetical protein QAD02_022217 [Eretmocerus hayati]